MPTQNAQHSFQEAITCLNLEQMMDYIENRHTQETQAKIAAHLQDCSFCRDAVDGLKAHPRREAVPSIVDSLNKRIQTQSAPVRVQAERNWTKYYALAAMLLLTISSLFYFMNRQPQHEKLFAAHFDHYPLDSLVRGETAAGDLALAAVKYEERNYAEALEIFRERLASQPENMTVRFYAGVCYLALDDTENAIDSFKAVLDSDESELREPAEWYLGLAYLQEPSEWYLGMAYLKQNDLANAESIFAGIAAGQGFYREKAAVILQSIRNR